MSSIKVMRETSHHLKSSRWSYMIFFSLGGSVTWCLCPWREPWWVPIVGAQSPWTCIAPCPRSPCSSSVLGLGARRPDGDAQAGYSSCSCWSNIHKLIFSMSMGVLVQLTSGFGSTRRTSCSAPSPLLSGSCFRCTSHYRLKLPRGSGRSIRSRSM